MTGCIWNENEKRHLYIWLRKNNFFTVPRKYFMRHFNNLRIVLLMMMMIFNETRRELPHLFVIKLHDFNASTLIYKWMFNISSCQKFIALIVTRCRKHSATFLVQIIIKYTNCAIYYSSLTLKQKIWFSLKLLQSKFNLFVPSLDGEEFFF